MDKDIHFPFSDGHEPSDDEIGSDELLSDENLRLPESANILVRLHAVRAWLSRRRDQAIIEVGEAALAIQEMMQEEAVGARPRRRLHQAEAAQLQFQRAQKALAESQQRLSAYEEAQSILEDCVAHTSGERVLVEYYLTLEDLVLQSQEQVDQTEVRSPWLDALSDVLHRVEQVGTPDEEE
jgi:4-amino-4-deoxy-L-arabinose transferase-like glycosyltransferase